MMDITNESVIMPIINKNFSYKERKNIINILTESTDMRNKVFSNIGNYFFKRINRLNFKDSLKDYSTSKGDILKCDTYKNMVLSLELLKHDQNPEVSKNAYIIEESISNIKSRKKGFELGFKSQNASLTRFFYSSLVKATTAAVSLLINESDILNYTTNNHKPLSHPLLDGLDVFNKCCKNGTVDKMVRYDLNLGNKIVKEGIFTDTISVGVSVASALITAIRNLVYWVYYTRIDIADYLEHQAAYIENNKIALENRKDIDEKKKKEIIKKQTEWQKKLLELSESIQIDDIKAARKAKEESDKDMKEMKSEDATNGHSGDSEALPDFF